MGQAHASLRNRMPSSVSRASRGWLHRFRAQVLGTVRCMERLLTLATAGSSYRGDKGEGGEGLWNSRQLEAEADAVQLAE